MEAIRSRARPDPRILRFIILLTALSADFMTGASNPSVRTLATSTGLPGTLVAPYAADGSFLHMVVTHIALADLTLNATGVSANDMVGQRDVIIVATGSPAVLVRYEKGSAQSIPHLDMVNLSAPGLSPSRHVLSFARDPRRGGAVGDELWEWDLSRQQGRKLLTLPGGRFIWATRWKDNRRLFALTGSRSTGDPEVVEFLDGRLTNRFPAALGASMEFGSGGTLFQVGSAKTESGKRPRTLLTDLVIGRSRELPSGWRPIAPSPDGRHMLMAHWEESERSIVERTRIGVSEISNPFTIRELGSVRGALQPGVWQMSTGTGT